MSFTIFSLPASTFNPCKHMESKFLITWTITISMTFIICILMGGGKQVYMLRHSIECTTSLWPSGKTLQCMLLHGVLTTVWDRKRVIIMCGISNSTQIQDMLFHCIFSPSTCRHVRAVVCFFVDLCSRGMFIRCCRCTRNNIGLFFS